DGGRSGCGNRPLVWWSSSPAGGACEHRLGLVLPATHRRNHRRHSGRRHRDLRMPGAAPLHRAAGPMIDAGNGETVLWLVRHPEPEVPARGRCYGSLDVALSPDGIRQARSVADRLAQETFTAIYTSPRQRCTRAAQILAAGRTCPVETMAALRELDFGR